MNNQYCFVRAASKRALLCGTTALLTCDGEGAPHQARDEAAVPQDGPPDKQERDRPAQLRPAASRRFRPPVERRAAAARGGGRRRSRGLGGAALARLQGRRLFVVVVVVRAVAGPRRRSRKRSPSHDDVCERLPHRSVKLGSLRVRVR